MSTPKSILEPTDFFIVSENEANLRLDKLLSLRFAALSRTYFQSLIEQGCVLVNHKIYKKRERVHAGDEIEICFLLTPELSVEPENIPLDILYEDEHLLAINKPAGMVVHPAPGHPNQTFVNALLHHCKTIEGMDPLRPGIVHRIDKDTTGVLLAAKTAECHRALVHLFATRNIEKTYLAICVGTPKEGLIDLPIKRHPRDRKKMAVCLEEGKEAKSCIRLLATHAGLSLVEIDLLTGRTHQIRVHMKHLQTPLLGDPIYGIESNNKKFKAERQLLHAQRVRFTHPFTNTLLTIEAPLPEDLSDYIQILNCQR